MSKKQFDDDAQNVALDRILYWLKKDRSLYPGLVRLYDRVGKMFISGAYDAPEKEISDFIDGLAIFFKKQEKKQEMNELCKPITDRVLRRVNSDPFQNLIIDNNSVESKTLTKGGSKITLNPNNLKSFRKQKKKLLLTPKDVFDLEMELANYHFKSQSHLEQNDNSKTDLNYWTNNQLGALLYFVACTGDIFSHKYMKRDCLKRLENLGFEGKRNAENIYKGYLKAKNLKAKSDDIFVVLKLFDNRWPQKADIIRNELTEYLKEGETS